MPDYQAPKPDSFRAAEAMLNDTWANWAELSDEERYGSLQNIIDELKKAQREIGEPGVDF